MTLTSSVLAVLLGLFPVSAAQSAQTPADDGKREFTISGCLLRSGYAGYQVDEATVDAIDGKSVPVARSSSARPATPALPTKWMLDGGGNLGPRVGEQVQIVGRSDWQPRSAAQPPDEPASRTPQLEVKSIKTIASMCV
jgi:hypothetical protein